MTAQPDTPRPSRPPTRAHPAVPGDPATPQAGAWQSAPTGGELDIAVTGDTLVLRGELDVATGTLVELASAPLVASCTHHAAREAVLDTTDLRFVDAAGLAALVSLNQALAEAGIALRTINASRQLRQVSALCGLDAVLHLPTIEQRQHHHRTNVEAPPGAPRFHSPSTDRSAAPPEPGPDVPAAEAPVMPARHPRIVAEPDSRPAAAHCARVELVASAEPSVVLASLAAQCVPSLCDGLLIDLTDRGARYRVAYPPDVGRFASAAGTDPSRMLQIRFTGQAAGGEQDQADGQDADSTHNGDRRSDEHRQPSLSGVATFAWHDRPPTAADGLLVAALIDQAVRTVAWQRSEQRAHAATVKADNLQIALQTSRQIGMATGILMSVHKITNSQALELLQVASQHSHRKLRDLALEVIHTGWLDPALLAATDLTPSRKTDTR